MRKIFSLFAAVLVALVANAAVINITNETPDALRLALNGASDGDEIVMAAGTYVESNDNYINFDGKAVTVKAAEGAEVIIQPQVPITVSNGGHAIFENVKIDASRLTELADWYEHLIYATDASANNRLIMDGCELYGFNLNKSAIYCSSANTLDAVTINNCYIHDCMKSILFVENTANAINVQVTNSTFANISTNTESYWAGVIDIRAAEATLTVDHCTFYNVIPMNTDYSCVSKITLVNGVTSNCIFMLPTAQDNIRAMRGVTATNCITFNYLKDSGTGIHSSVTQNNCVQVDPLFVDAANNNFTLGENSPALTMNDGQPIGDPRWVPAAAPAHTYTVAGGSTDLFGTAWDPANAANDMVLQEDNTYKWEKADLELAAGDIEFKVCEDHAWTVAYPAQNYVLNIAEAGIYTIAIYFNPNDNNYVGAIATKTGDAVVIPTVAMHGNFLGSWADTENFAVAEGDATASLTLTLSEGNYEFGMRIGGSGNWTSNGVAFTRENNAAEVVAGQGNLTLAADAAGEYTFTWTYETNNLAITFPAAAPAEMTVIYDWAGEVGTTILGTTGVEISTVKIHTNTDAISGIKFGSSYVYADGKWIAIKPAEGGFKAGDKLSVAAVFNNANENNDKYAQIDLRAADGDTRIWLSDSASTINGRLVGDEPIVQTYTLEADQDSLLLGRYGNTGMFITLLKVERAAGDEPQPQECDWDAIDFLGDGSPEQTFGNQFKVCKTGEQPGVVNIQKPGFAAESGIYVTFPSAVFGNISLAEGQYAIDGAGIVLYCSAFTQEYTEVTVNWDGNDIVFTVYNAAAAPQPVEHTYTVAGGSADLFGTTWDPTNAANDMAKLEDGTYKWEKTEVTLPAGNVEFKVVEDHAWTVCYPAENYQLVIPEAGVYTITITYNPEGNVVAGDAVKTGDAVVDPVVSIAGSMNSWNASADVMVLAEDKATASLTLNLAAQTYEFKVVINGGDWRSNAHEFTRENAVAADMSGNLDNMHLVADIAGDYIFTWTFETNTLSIAFPIGDGIDNTAVETKAIKRIVNGQLFIEMNGVLYNAQGTIVR